ncbi:MAG: ABC transporter ATP-binding protein [Lachnospiraceae bacterium]|nr:ABC transporter ATP-binding protein [Lachnospiraceae bacterium]
MKGQKEPVLAVKELCVSFTMYDRGLNRREFEMVHQLSLTVNAGEIVAVAGSSGSGKSLLAHGILGILPENAKVTGTMEFCGRRLEEASLKKLRGREIAFIPQSVKYLDPLMKVGRQVIGPCSRAEKKERQEKLKQVFARYQLEESVANLYPYQLSGGMARRVLISGAVMKPAKLIVADEPTPGLQEELARETLCNFRELAQEGCGVLLITHDIDLALQMADRIAIFYDGKILETVPAAAFSGDGRALAHPYSRAFLRALPQNEFAAKQKFPGAGNAEGFRQRII